MLLTRCSTTSMGADCNLEIGLPDPTTYTRSEQKAFTAQATRRYPKCAACGNRDQDSDAAVK